VSTFGAPDLSVVLPSYRAGALARQSIGVLGDFLSAGALEFEIILVEDGPNEGERLTPEDSRVRVLTLPANRGKGAAVRAGMQEARGRVRVFTDVDLPYDLQLIPVIMEYIERGFHLVIGDRTLRGSRYYLDVGWRRRLASSLFSLFVGKLVTGGFFDTQCGLKAFRGDVASHLFSLARVDRFAFDVELLYLALVHRLDIKRIPVRLRHNETSSVRLVRDSTRMLLDVLGIKVRQMQGAYQCAALEELVLTDFLECRSRARGAPKESEGLLL
jgi:dolichyl-phosphate beta-glucosyltransferase